MKIKIFTDNGTFTHKADLEDEVNKFAETVDVVSMGIEMAPADESYTIVIVVFYNDLVSPRAPKNSQETLLLELMRHGVNDESCEAVWNIICKSWRQEHWDEFREKVYNPLSEDT